ncbi:MAG TPA: hypothetical protein VLT16_03560 [Candidatus Limnocylindrales bacterium]|nr:hypothetical protein [Candidatus Limnocylindrales bacterium]
MKIFRYPYQASIAPQAAQTDSLWDCVIRREGSLHIVARHEAARKEDACALALLELSRLQRGPSGRRFEKAG